MHLKKPQTPEAKYDTMKGEIDISTIIETSVLHSQ